MKMERPLRVFIGLAIMAATVSAVGSIGGWSRAEPPEHGSQPAGAPKPENKPDTAAAGMPESNPGVKPESARQNPSKSTKAEPVRIEPAWNAEAPRQGAPSRPARANARADTAPGAPLSRAHASKAEPAELPPQAAPRAPADVPLSAADALRALEEGNERWMNSSVEAPNTSESRRRAVAENGQTPFATILTCADSRVPVERVFDRGVGDLFVLRVAGNVVGPHEAGTIEYGAEHLHVPLLVVMGHTGCGAVGAAASGKAADGNVASLIASITPAVQRARTQNASLADAELAAASVRENVWQSVFDLIRASPACRERVRSGELRIVGAVYDMASGRVDWLGEHPWQREIIAAMEAPAGDRHAEAASETQPETH